MATWCEQLTHWKRPWEILRAGGEGDNRGWVGWTALRTQWTWVWVDSGSWWWTGMLGVLQSMGSQRVGQYWVTELNWTGHSSASTYGREPCSSGLQTRFQQDCFSPFKPVKKLFLSRCYENTPYKEILSYYTECFSWSQRQNKDLKISKNCQLYAK